MPALPDDPTSSVPRTDGDMVLESVKAQYPELDEEFSTVCGPMKGVDSGKLYVVTTDTDSEIVEEHFVIECKNGECLYFQDGEEFARYLDSSAASASSLLSTNNVTAVMALVLLITVCVLALIGTEIPKSLEGAFVLVIGFFFGRNTS